MNQEKFTQKSMEALSAGHEFAVKYKHISIKKEHLLLALVSQMEGLIPKLLEKMEINTSNFIGKIENNLNSMAKVSIVNPTSIYMDN